MWVKGRILRTIAEKKEKNALWEIFGIFKDIPHFMSEVDRGIIFIVFSDSDLVSESDDEMFLKIEEYTSWKMCGTLGVLMI